MADFGISTLESRQYDPNMRSVFRSWYSRLFAVGLIGLCALVLSLPVFPSGDGAMHLYYAHILKSLLSGSPVYDHFYSIRHAIQPYCLNYFTQIALEHLVSPWMAEKLFVVAILLITGSGFFYLCRTIGTGEEVYLLGFPFLFPWCLIAGFYNYCLAAGIMLWALGLWASLCTKESRGYLVAFATVVSLLVLTHPIPLLLLVAYLGFDLLLVSKTMEHRPRAFLAMAIACAGLLMPLLIADKAQLAVDAGHFGLHLEVTLAILGGLCLNPFNQLDLAGAVQQIMLLGSLPLLLVVILPATLDRVKRRQMQFQDRLILCSLLFVVASFFLPEDLNGSYFFSERVALCPWLVMIACGAAIDKKDVFRKVLGVGGGVITGIFLASAVHILPPISKSLAAIGETPLPQGKAGVFVETADAHSLLPLNYPVYYWSGVRAFSRSHSILLNSPWMGQTILPLKQSGSSRLLDDRLTYQEVNEPTSLYYRMQNSLDARERVLPTADFVYLVTGPHEKEPLKAIRKAIAGDTSQWNCQAGHLYALCVKADNDVLAARR